MTVTLSKPTTPITTRWGVEFEGSPSPDRVTVSVDEQAARRFLRGLEFCGNRDARLVVNTGAGWHLVETAVTS